MALSGRPCKRRRAVARRVVQLLDQYGLHAAPDHVPSYTFRTFAGESYRLRLEHKAAESL